MLIWSGPRELFVLLFRMACTTSAVVSSIFVGFRCLICLEIALFCLSVWWGVGVVNFLLNAFAMSLLLWRGRLKLIVMFSCWGGRLSESCLIVFQSVWVFFLDDQSPVIFSFQMFCLCCLMSLVISMLSGASWGLVGFALRMLFLVFILSRMCVGRALGLC